MVRSVQFLVLTVALVSLRLIYVWIEGSYNVALLDMLATPFLTSEAASEVQELGHKLAALGLALLVTPLIVAYAVKGVSGKWRQLSQGTVAGIAGFLALYVCGYNLQTWAMDTAVDSTSAETRYNAYYETLFRQLYIDGSISDDGFSPTTKSASYVMWLPFGVSALSDLPSSLKGTASDLVMERAQKQAALERFSNDYAAYRSYQKFTEDFLTRYRMISNEALAKVDPNESSIANLYGSIVESIYDLYPAYVSINEKHDEHVAYMASNQWLRNDVNNLFSTSKNERQWRHQALIKKVGLEESNVTWESWCDDSGCPGSNAHLRQVIKHGLREKYAYRAFGVPMGLSLKEFLQAPEAFNRALVMKGQDPVFEGSLVTFGQFVDKMENAQLAPDISAVLSRWFPEVEGLHVPAGLTDQEIIDSAQFQDLVRSQVGSRIAEFPVTLKKSEFFEEWLKVSADVLEGKRATLLPDSPEQMLEGDRVEAGLAAVRLLYIPPIAAAMSAVMIVLNLAAIFGGLFPGRKSQWFLRCAFLAVLVVGGLSVGGSMSMPTALQEEIWGGFSTERIVMDIGWQAFFGVEVTITQLSEDSGIVLSASTINTALDTYLGWAL